MSKTKARWIELDYLASNTKDAIWAGNVLYGVGVTIQSKIVSINEDLSVHISDFSNPHVVTKSQVGLGLADNTSDTNKPVSGATQTALNLKINLSEKGQAGGVAPLDGSSKIDPTYLPAIAITDTYVVANQAAQLALVAQKGDVAVRSDLNQSFIHNGGVAGTIDDWTLLKTPTDSVISVAGKTGVVTLALNELSNVAVPSPAEGHILQYVSGSWINASLSAGHTQNTDTGTTSPSFTLNNDAASTAENTSLFFGQTSSQYLRYNPTSLFFEFSTKVAIPTGSTWSGAIIAPAFGGTGLSTYTANRLLFASAATTIGQVAINSTANRMFLMQVSSGVPAFASIANTDVSGLGTASIRNVPASGNALSTDVVLGTDTRLTDARTPAAHNHTKSQITDFAHTHPISDVTNLQSSLDSKASTSGTALTTFAIGNLSNTNNTNISLRFGDGINGSTKFLTWNFTESAFVFDDDVKATSFIGAWAGSIIGDTYLSSNIPRLNTANTFVGNQTVTGNISSTAFVSASRFDVGGSYSTGYLSFEGSTFSLDDDVSGGLSNLTMGGTCTAGSFIGAWAGSIIGDTYLSTAANDAITKRHAVNQDTGTNQAAFTITSTTASLPTLNFSNTPGAYSSSISFQGDQFNINNKLFVTSSVTATSFSGSGTGLTSLQNSMKRVEIAITNPTVKSAALGAKVLDINNVSVFVAYGPMQMQGTDYILTESGGFGTGYNTIDWSEKGMDGVLIAGDIIVVVFQPKP